MIGYTHPLGVQHYKTQEASESLSSIQALQRPRRESTLTLGNSDASSTASYLRDASLLPSSVSSLSETLPQAGEFIIELVCLLYEGEDIRATIWKALERSKDEKSDSINQG